MPVALSILAKQVPLRFRIAAMAALLSRVRNVNSQHERI
jgi:hypothetical protein